MSNSKKRTDYISWDEYFMGVADLSGRRSKDPGGCLYCQRGQQDHVHGLQWISKGLFR